MYKNQKEHSETIQNHILDVMNKHEPNSIEELVELVNSTYHHPKNKILSNVLDLEKQRKIFLKKNSKISPSSEKYFFSTKTMWYWAIVFTSLMIIALIYVIPEDFYPIIYLKYPFGLILVIFFPGFSLLRVLFPANEIDTVERVALSIGLSIALVSITGLVLNYTPLGITINSLAISLFILVLFFATLALLREYQNMLINKTNN